MNGKPLMMSTHVDTLKILLLYSSSSELIDECMSLIRVLYYFIFFFCSGTLKFVVLDEITSDHDHL